MRLSECERTTFSSQREEMAFNASRRKPPLRKAPVKIVWLGFSVYFNNHRKRAEQALCDVTATAHGEDGSPPGVGGRLELG